MWRLIQLSLLLCAEYPNLSCNARVLSVKIPVLRRIYKFESPMLEFWVGKFKFLVANLEFRVKCGVHEWLSMLPTRLSIFISIILPVVIHTHFNYFTRRSSERGSGVTQWFPVFPVRFLHYIRLLGLYGAGNVEPRMRFEHPKTSIQN